MYKKDLNLKNKFDKILDKVFKNSPELRKKFEIEYVESDYEINILEKFKDKMLPHEDRIRAKVFLDLNFDRDNYFMNTITNALIPVLYSFEDFLNENEFIKEKGFSVFNYITRGKTFWGYINSQKFKELILMKLPLMLIKSIFENKDFKIGSFLMINNRTILIKEKYKKKSLVIRFKNPILTVANIFNLFKCFKEKNIKLSYLKEELKDDIYFFITSKIKIFLYSYLIDLPHESIYLKSSRFIENLFNYIKKYSNLLFKLEDDDIREEFYRQIEIRELMFDYIKKELQNAFVLFKEYILYTIWKMKLNKIYSYYVNELEEEYEKYYEYIVNENFEVFNESNLYTKFRNLKNNEGFAILIINDD